MKFRKLTEKEVEFVAGGTCPYYKTRCPSAYDDRWGPGADESEENIADGYYQDAYEDYYG